MRRFSDLPIKYKLTLISLLTTTVALLLVSGGVVAYEVVSFKRDLVSDASSLAEIIGTNSAAALSLRDTGSAEQILEALNLSAKPHIVAACIYGPDGRVFATYPRGHNAADFAPPPDVATATFAAGHLDLFRPIVAAHRNVGTIYLRADFAELREQLGRFALIIGAVMVLALVLANLLASRLQRVISAPVADLVAVAGRVALERDYTVRAVKRGDDELGQLIDSFNNMLGEIQAREAALRSANDSLERRVEERTASLADASSLLDAMLDNSPDFIYFKDRASRFVRFSKACLHNVGLTDPEMMRGKTDADFSAPAHALPAYADEQEIIRTGRPIIGKLERETHSDGRVTWALTTKMPWRDGTGAIVGTLGISRDISALKEAEGKLAHEREQWRTLLDSIPDTIYFKDVQSLRRCLTSARAGRLAVFPRTCPNRSC
jgi:PAS domain S-box-containing protein